MIMSGVAIGVAASYGLIWIFNQAGPGLFYIPVSFNLIITAMILATLTGLLAAAIPSRRAARLDPVVAIRCGWNSYAKPITWAS